MTAEYLSRPPRVSAGVRQSGMKQLAFLMGIALPLTTGCTTHITVTEKGHTLAEHEPSEGMVHPYPGLDPRQSLPGPYVAVLLSTESDLEQLAKNLTHHLYFKILPCSQRSHNFQLVSGTVFMASEVERNRVLGPHSKQGLYKVHIPLNLQAIVEHAKFQGTLDVPSYVEQARSDGLCIQGVVPLSVES
jgi:hypothetical protein